MREEGRPENAAEQGLVGLLAPKCRRKIMQFLSPGAL